MNTVQYYAILEVVLFVRQVGYIGVVWAVVWYEMALLLYDATFHSQTVGHNDNLTVSFGIKLHWHLYILTLYLHIVWLYSLK